MKNEQNYDPMRVLSAALDLGERLLVSGGEVSRVEDTLTRILRAYGAERVDVFTITSSIVVTVRMPDGGIFTQTRRVPAQNVDFARMSALNELSRRVCRAPVAPETLAADIRGIDSAPPIRFWFMTAVWALVSASFCVFFGGSALDAGCSALVGMLLCLIRSVLSRVRLNGYISVILLSVFGGLLSGVPVRLGLDAHPEAISIGSIMLLIPGIALTNSIRDMFSGDTITGLLRSAEAMVLSLGVAWGFAATDAGAITGAATTVQAGLISALLGSVGFGLLFNVRGLNLWLGSLGSTLAYAIVLLCPRLGIGEIAGYFLASAGVTLWAELLAKKRRGPVTLFLVVSIISLVPGGSLYRTMRYAIAENWGAFAMQGLRTVLYAIAISAGIVSITALADVLRRLRAARR